MNSQMHPPISKYKAEEREIWTAEMLMQAIDACENKWLKVAFHLAFAATVRIGELLGLTWDCVDVSEEAIAENRAYIFINKQVERVSRNAVDELDAKEVILIFPSQKKNNKTVRLLKHLRRIPVSGRYIFLNLWHRSWSISKRNRMN